MRLEASRRKLQKQGNQNQRVSKEECSNMVSGFLEDERTENVF